MLSNWFSATLGCFAISSSAFVAGQTTTAPEAFFEAPNGPGDLFGRALDVDGATLVVGAQWEDSSATGVDGDSLDNSMNNAGAAYVFVRSGTDWIQQAYLKASNTDAGDNFGWSVAVDGDTVVVGALYESSQATGVNGDGSDNLAQFSGAAYVFTRTGTTWSPQAYLKASDNEAFRAFGDSVAVDGNTIVVGSDNKGSAYVFERSGTDWTEQAILSVAGPSIHVESVAISNDTALLGCSQDPAHVYVRSGTTWSLQATLVGSNTVTSDSFGRAVSVDGDTAIVSAHHEDSAATGVDGDGLDNSVTSAGAAYVFARNGTDWTQQAYLKAFNTGTGFEFFGLSVSVSGDRVVVGAQNEDGGAAGVNGPYWTVGPAFSRGAAYLFERVGTSWSSSDYLKSSYPGGPFGSVMFGQGVAIEGGRICVGGQSGNGSIDTYVLDVPVVLGPYCTAKASAAGCLASVTTSDVSAHPVSGEFDYWVFAGAVEGKRNGLLFAGPGPTNVALLGGTLCVQPPLKRGPVINSGPADSQGCAGGFGLIVNDGAILPNGLDAGPGNSAWYQFWYRTPLAVDDVAFSNAVQLDFQ